MEKVSRWAGEKVGICVKISKKHTFTFTPLEVGRLGRPSRLRRAVLMGLSHFLTSKGFTLIELLIAILILSGGIFLLLTMFTTGLDGVFANQKRTQATNLAQDLMDEILGKEFREPTAAQQPGWGINTDETQGDRTTYDDVDDYSAWKNKKPPKDVMGTSLTTYADFTRSVSVAFVSAYDLQTPMGTGANTPCKRIIVYVEHSDISTVSLYGLKTLSVY